MSFDEICDQLAEYNCRLVEVTGGEPLAQEQVIPFMGALCDRGYDVLLETSGSLDISHVDPRVRRIMDIKCPGSGMVAALISDSPSVVPAPNPFPTDL